MVLKSELGEMQEIVVVENALVVLVLLVQVLLVEVIVLARMHLVEVVNILPRFQQMR